jgi:beta-glucosidase
VARIETDEFMNAVADKMDYVGLDYYYPAYDQVAPLVDLAAGTSWRIPDEPFGMYTALQVAARALPAPARPHNRERHAHRQRQAARRRVTRQDLMRDTLYWVQRARADGVPVVGYMYWSLTDNYEWGTYRPRFGLYRVDVTTDPKLVRHPTAGVPAYRRLIARRGVPGDYRLTQRPTAANCRTESVRPADRPVCLAAVAR